MRLSWSMSVSYLLVAAGILTAAPLGGLSITEYGAKGDGKELCTEAIDRALEVCAQAGGGTVLVPAGTFLTGAIKLPSHVILQLGAGAVLKGSTNLADYQVDGRRYPLIRAEKAENIAFSNIIAESESGIVLYGSRPGDISNVSLDGVTLHVRNSPLNASYGGNFDLRPAYDTRFAIFKHDIPAVFSRYTDGLTIRRLDLQWDDGLPEFFDHAIVCEHFTHLVIDAFHGRPPHRGGTNAAIALQHGRDTIIRNCIAAEGTATFLSHEDVTSHVLLANNDLAHAGKPVLPEANDFTSVGNLVSK